LGPFSCSLVFPLASEKNAPHAEGRQDRKGRLHRHQELRISLWLDLSCTWAEQKPTGNSLAENLIGPTHGPDRAMPLKRIK
jgi:hypothetical protein